MGVTAQQEQTSAATFGAEGDSLGENLEQVMGFWLPPEALCQEAAGSSNCPRTRANNSAAETAEIRIVPTSSERKKKGEGVY